MAWTPTQQKVVAIVPKCSALLSLAGSLWIVIEVTFDSQKSRNVYHQLLFAMSIYDVLESIFNFASSWAIPEGTEGVWNPIGSQESCSTQGYFLQLGLGIPIYNASLSIYYLLVIQYGVTEQRLRRWVAPCMHAAAFVISFGTATAALPLDLYNNANLWCWIAPLPAGCDKDSTVQCIRGDHAWLYRWLFYFTPLWSSIVTSIVCTIMVYLSVRKREVKTAHYRCPTTQSVSKKSVNSHIFDSHRGFGRYLNNGPSAGSGRTSCFLGNHESDKTNNQRPSFLQRSQQSLRNAFQRTLTSMGRDSEQRRVNPRSREVLNQAIFFVMAFWMTHLFSTINRALQLSQGFTYFPLVVLHACFDPLQGFLNFLVYRRPRYMRHRNRSPDMTRREALQRTIRWSFLGPVDKQKKQPIAYSDDSSDADGSQQPPSQLDIINEDSRNVPSDSIDIPMDPNDDENIHPNSEMVAAPESGDSSCSIHEERNTYSFSDQIRMRTKATASLMASSNTSQRDELVIGRPDIPTIETRSPRYAPDAAGNYEMGEPCTGNEQSRQKPELPRRPSGLLLLADDVLDVVDIYPMQDETFALENDSFGQTSWTSDNAVGSHNDIPKDDDWIDDENNRKGEDEEEKVNRYGHTDEENK